MKSLIFILILFTINLSANTDVLRITNLQKFITLLSKKDLQQKLELVNFYFNQITSEYDTANNQNTDVWDTMIDFIQKGQGDCEEYAIGKYTILNKIGIDKSKLFLMIVREENSPQDQFHMVTAYFMDKNDPLILDNLSYKILPLSKRIDLIPILLFNELTAFQIDEKSNKILSLKAIKTDLPKKLSALEVLSDFQLETHKIIFSSSK